MNSDSKHDIINYYKIKLDDLVPDKPLPVNIYIYLKKNKRVILLRKKRFVLEESRFSYFQKKEFDQIYIKIEDKNTFIKYLSEKDDFSNTFILHDDETSTQIPEFIAKEILNVVSGETFEKHNECIKIISSIESKNDSISVKGRNKKDDDFYSISGGKENLDEKNSLLRVSSTNDKFLNHAQSVSKFSIMFAKNLGLDHPKILENIAVASLFHDIGYSKLPSEIRNKNVLDLLPEERDLYESHPEIALQIFKEKNETNDMVQKIILQHHENFDGTGFPNGLKGIKIHELARILAIANELDHLLIKDPSYNHSIKQALSKIREKSRKQKSVRLDPVLLNKIINSFLTPKDIYERIGKPSTLSPTL